VELNGRLFVKEIYYFFFGEIHYFLFELKLKRKFVFAGIKMEHFNCGALAT
jgi:hypothetical protein